MSNNELGKAASFGDPTLVTGNSGSGWIEKYSEVHRLVRVTEFPLGINPPGKVRIYRRRDHYVLQCWDRDEKKTLSERVDGDLIDAISTARRIDERLESHRGSGRRSRRIGHVELVGHYVADLKQRADAGEIDVATVVRYRSALDH